MSVWTSPWEYTSASGNFTDFFRTRDWKRGTVWVFVILLPDSSSFCLIPFSSSSYTVSWFSSAEDKTSIHSGLCWCYHPENEEGSIYSCTSLGSDRNKVRNSWNYQGKRSKRKKEMLRKLLYFSFMILSCILSFTLCDSRGRQQALPRYYLEVYIDKRKKAIRCSFVRDNQSCWEATLLSPPAEKRGGR